MSSSVIDLLATEARFGAHNYQPIGVVLTRGEGVWVWDIEGNRYLDCLSAYSAVNQGHCHPKILAAMVEQARPADADLARLPQRPARPVLRRDRGADRLPQGAADEQRRRGGRKRDQVGAQMGLRGQGRAGRPGRDHRLRRQLPRTHAGHRRLLHRRRDARTLSARSRRASRSSRSATPRRSKQRSRRTPSPSWSSRSRARPASSFPRPAISREVRELCTANNVMLILDEIQTGLGRTGKLLAEQHEGIEADVTLLGKALSGGFYPVSAVLSNNDVLGHTATRAAWLDLRRQPAGLRGRARGAARAGRGRHDRERGHAGRALPAKA